MYFRSCTNLGMMEEENRWARNSICCEDEPASVARASRRVTFAVLPPATWATILEDPCTQYDLLSVDFAICVRSMPLGTAISDPGPQNEI